MDLVDHHVPNGLAAYRHRVRRWGAAAGLGVPALTMIAAVVLYQASPCNGATCVKGRLGSWVLAAFALPTALPCGLPLRSGWLRYALALMTSAGFWLLLGWIAARRVGRRAVVSWHAWWGEFGWYLAAVWVGELIGLRLLAAVLVRRGLTG